MLTMKREAGRDKKNTRPVAWVINLCQEHYKKRDHSCQQPSPSVRLLENQKEGRQNKERDNNVLTGPRLLQSSLPWGHIHCNLLLSRLNTDHPVSWSLDRTVTSRLSPAEDDERRYWVSVIATDCALYLPPRVLPMLATNSLLSSHWLPFEERTNESMTENRCMSENYLNSLPPLDWLL